MSDHPRLKTGIVIGHYNQPEAIALQIACIRHRCAEVPILISDDCSDGFCPTPEPYTPFGSLVGMAARSKGVFLWPNVGRIGHAGGDMAAFWKGIIWGAACGLDVVFKLSQRFIIDIPNWTQESAALLMESGLATLGRGCAHHGWQLRTEAVGLRVDRWHTPEILAHLTPRPIAWAAEQVISDDVRDRLDNRLCEWPLMAPARPMRADGVLFREADTPEDYAALGQRLGLGRTLINCADSNQMPGYKLG